MSTMLLTSCGGMIRGMSGATQSTLIKQISVETGCPKDKIKILDMKRNAGAGVFSVDVCGETKIYKQVGTIFMSNEEASNLMDKMSK